MSENAVTGRHRFSLERRRTHENPPVSHSTRAPCFEYKLVYGDGAWVQGSSPEAKLNEELNEVGEQGWELVQVVPRPRGDELWVFIRERALEPMEGNETSPGLEKA